MKMEYGEFESAFRFSGDIPNAIIPGEKQLNLSSPGA
jgi:hypothetical protein